MSISRSTSGADLQGERQGVIVTTERRRNSRIQVLGRLHGQVVALDMPVRLVDISLGGLRVETDLAFPEGAIHEFRLALGDGSAVVLQGRVLHCRRVQPQRDDGGDLYVSGVEFIDDNVGVDELIDRLK